ncbi:MAG: CPBP family intramembrane metalloprotease [Anaerohalosphaeraceae bacterium]|nr:CPBP family intramembrane metalloprotease [Anaerohalosphaeraceae bacterium]
MLLSRISILAQSAGDSGGLPISDYLTVLMVVAGVAIFVRWLYASRFGRDAFSGCPVRQTNMPVFLPIVMMALWLLLLLAGPGLAELVTVDMSDWQKQFGTFASTAAVEIILIVVVLVIVQKFFAGGLSGFGFQLKNIFPDLRAAVLILLAAWPFILVSLVIVLQIGRLLKGAGFELEQNEGLKVILDFDNLSLRILTISFAVVLTPFFEEFLFRGILQNSMRNIGAGRWQSIIIVSLIFSALHPLTHFSALMILSVCMGYAYEKSNSILRPIFVHLLFNGVTVAMSLLS